MISCNISPATHCLNAKYEQKQVGKGGACRHVQRNEMEHTLSSHCNMAVRRKTLFNT